jgi:hypothetical protein
MKQPNPERLVITNGIHLHEASASHIRHPLPGSATHHSTLCWGIPPWLITAQEHTQMAPPHKLLIAQTQLFEIQKVWMENNLDAIIAGVEQLHAANLVQDQDHLRCQPRFVL